MEPRDDGLEWQIDVWDRMSQNYLQEIDRRFLETVRHCVERAQLRPGDHVLDLGTGTGTAAVEAAGKVGAGGSVLAVDVSLEMLRLAESRFRTMGLGNARVAEGRAEQIPADAETFDALVACLSLMYAIDREAAAQECARVLRPAGRFCAAVWGAPEEADLILFQQTGTFAPAPPVPGVGPGALADPTEFLVS